MITSAVLYFFLALLDGLFWILPSATELPAAIENALDYLAPYISLVVTFPVINTLFAIVSLGLLVQIGWQSVTWSHTVYKMIRG